MPRLALLLGSLPRKELSERAWETPLVPSLPQLQSCLPLHIGARRGWGGLRGWWVAHCQGLQQ